MQKILILGLGAFGFAIAKHLGVQNPHQKFYASEINTEIFDAIALSRKHPYFFSEIEHNTLPENIELLSENTNILPEIDLLISVIPCQFIGKAFSSMSGSLKDGVTILNLAKGIDNNSLQTASEKLTSILDANSFHYAYLAGGMIASELVTGNILGADIVTDDQQRGESLKALFQSPTLDIKLKICTTQHTELYAALKNIVALSLGYYEGKGAGASSLGYYFTIFMSEFSDIVEVLSEKHQLDLTDFSLSGDLIATCFGESRNRELGNMLGMGVDSHEALALLQAQNKTAEGYETLKGIFPLLQEHKICPHMQKIAKILL